ncbi:uncharacterized protein PHACADRAFT_252650 [Phanerochaete carnosa HHB-10118-sp]|uniref:Uncharacterized protein n=1 Tax=Phanerochaete carnosa (strain HHB-10118-sp) TaxID=650164 RepID=K5WH17_PHACS|nr:uncharacterized protein PHACADRAFT_252650 [Phanerochaete carnosa HHB-10118-sp]EKM58379.1 hypothetical protein PHACADRAFT_252650 [Phanerochaete carnosa HHB-10118-sp]
MNRSSSSINTNSTGFAGAQPSGFTGGYTQQPQQTGYPTSPTGGHPQQTGFNAGYGAQQAQSTGRPFQPASSFGQQLASQVNGAYGQQPVPQQQQQQQQQQYSGYPTPPQYGTAYGYPQQQQPQQTQYLAEFDPYAPQQTSAQGQGPSQNKYQTPHPRDYVRNNKQGLESWDSYAWKQVMNCFDTLKDAWANRKKELEARMNAVSGQGLFGGGGYGGGYSYGNQYGRYGQQQQYAQAQEYSRLEQLAKQADSNVDIVVAASFQMNEAHDGYRQSGDLASKKRVREAINAALGNLPDWPAENY